MSVDLERAVRIDTGGVALEGDLLAPEGALALVVFAHGSGSSRFSPRNRHVARLLNKRRLATLLVDLLTPEEEERDTSPGPMQGRLRFDINLLADRLVGATDWAAGDPATRSLPLGYFGASTGAAAALVAAALRADRVGAVVSRGGRPDLADVALRDVRAPTLFIVGASDPQVLELNRMALKMMSCVRELAIVPRASHLFEEPGALDEVARLARDWFLRHLAHVAQPA
jgi:pimeloyl-ACP methyl ester carboxylesterase